METTLITIVFRTDFSYKKMEHGILVHSSYMQLMKGLQGSWNDSAGSLNYAAVTVHQQEISGFPGAFSYHPKCRFMLTATQLP